LRPALRHLPPERLLLRGRLPARPGARPAEELRLDLVILRKVGEELGRHGLEGV
jgi:hypothetical protein